MDPVGEVTLLGTGVKKSQIEEGSLWHTFTRLATKTEPLTLSSASDAVIQHHQHSGPIAVVLVLR